MKLIIAGNRNFNLDITTIQNLFDLTISYELGMPSEVVSGTCRGVDISGENWAKFYNIPIKRFKPDWKSLGRKAGPIRNIQMAEYGDVLLVIYNGDSKSGSANMKMQMKKLNKPVYEVIIRSASTKGETR